MNTSKKIFSTKEKEIIPAANLEAKKNVEQQLEMGKSNQEAAKAIEMVSSPISTTLETALSQTNKVNSTALAHTVAFKKIEAILEDDLEELYFKMDETHRRIFKEEGEKTAYQIERVIVAGKSVVFKIIELIKHWLNFIPGINKFFVTQASKIKTDKILKDFNFKDK